MKIMLFIIRLC